MAGRPRRGQPRWRWILAGVVFSGLVGAAVWTGNDWGDDAPGRVITGPAVPPPPPRVVPDAVVQPLAAVEPPSLPLTEPPLAVDARVVLPGDERLAFELVAITQAGDPGRIRYRLNGGTTRDAGRGDPIGAGFRVLAIDPASVTISNGRAGFEVRPPGVTLTQEDNVPDAGVPF
ncbi:hypothetical protein GO308_11255 [Sphingomonas sp. SFZ2018-12]|uniref:hypothetical protein n=1 Tax=Sphingomonas sp. SFZ2018-12 TaxID=2683197 RepID=UPI001F0F584D|nr:hypothetical protein [Sphingomonas sp. SFZ2018-12]MCH4893688.1 hypothetical protein [Sphingomonas sp. SFZ2018-12]